MASVLILIKYKRRCQRKVGMALLSLIDAIGNVAVMLAAFTVWSTATGWLDVIVAAILASLFLNSPTRFCVTPSTSGG